MPFEGYDWSFLFEGDDQIVREDVLLSAYSIFRPLQSQEEKELNDILNSHDCIQPTANNEYQWSVRQTDYSSTSTTTRKPQVRIMAKKVNVFKVVKTESQSQNQTQQPSTSTAGQKKPERKRKRVILAPSQGVNNVDTRINNELAEFTRSSLDFARFEENVGASSSSALSQPMPVPVPAAAPSPVPVRSRVRMSAPTPSAGRARSGAQSQRGRVARQNAPVANPDYEQFPAGLYPKPTWSYSVMIALALRNCREGSLTVAEIYHFMLYHFPYFRTAPPAWKNSVRHNLSLNKCFEKDPEHLHSSNPQHKSCLWQMVDDKVYKINDDIRKCRERGLVEGLMYPHLMSQMEAGKVGFPPFEQTNFKNAYKVNRVLTPQNLNAPTTSNPAPPQPVQQPIVVPNHEETENQPIQE